MLSNLIWLEEFSRNKAFSESMRNYKEKQKPSEIVKESDNSPEPLVVLSNPAEGERKCLTPLSGTIHT